MYIVKRSNVDRCKIFSDKLTFNKVQPATVRNYFNGNKLSIRAAFLMGFITQLRVYVQVGSFKFVEDLTTNKTTFIIEVREYMAAYPTLPIDAHTGTDEK